MTDQKRMQIPPEEFGAGCKIDIARNIFIGASGTIYRDLRIKREDFDRLCDKLGIARPPKIQ